MVLFIILDYFTVRTVYSQPGHDLLGTITIVGAIVQVFTYIIVAISNPGVVTQADFGAEGEE